MRKIYGRILSKCSRYTDVYQGILAKLCREDFVLMRGRELLEVPYIYYTRFPQKYKGASRVPKTVAPQNKNAVQLHGAIKRISQQCRAAAPDDARA